MAVITIICLRYAKNGDNSVATTSNSRAAILADTKWMIGMKLSNKVGLIGDAIAMIGDGAVIMLGGFGVPGTPFCLIRELVRQGPRGLTIIKNDANEARMGVDWLLESGQVARLITTHVGLNPRAMRMMNDGAIEVEFVPQGILAERIRIAGAGMMGFVTDIGLGTPLEDGKTRVTVDGRAGLLETALTADFALVHAARADCFGNLSFAASARNFNPLMAMAARKTIVETESLASLGALAPEDIHLSGTFVDHVVELSELPEVYGVVKR
ncbi:CoA transferase subunit A [Mesorhizobium sp. WSM4307]|jgi:3-oxoacid CoA-transferase, A subunit|uniref:CoA transferase subunit A n=1 Tax=unclassified Mesorhizobium TaxID=325217 RepID=UPI000BB000C2|nr:MULTISPECIES: CoA transferase subunit A [unclassified Mesorhizobium]PBB24522.1 acetate CoA-transferase [Mesorhizobium sp. WSM4304]PBB74510.1 acetate CoA-transferase [Mesorhizobium sp. WSM4308]TRC73335.1 CoA transferase subunit A [Mesorhizobium sp. WSM4315]TRC83614.1 CoA transferase subunit A [Mesorhizobium sp. WSM4307]